MSWVPDRAAWFRIGKAPGASSLTIEFQRNAADFLFVDDLKLIHSNILPIHELPEVLRNHDNQQMQHTAAVEQVCGEIRRLKQERYQDATGDDWIDECERTMSWSEFVGAMKFTIGKYLRRLGKKDHELQEMEKIADYAERMLAAAKRHHSVDERV